MGAFQVGDKIHAPIEPVVQGSVKEPTGNEGVRRISTTLETFLI
jgi:hypothetical protein